MARVYGISGQSNAKADLSAGPPSDPTLIGVLPNIFIWNTTTVAWEPLQYNVNNMGFSGALNGFGVELKLGRLAALNFVGENIYIIKYAVSGTALGREYATDQNWGRGDGLLYDIMISTYNQALAAIPEAYTVEGIYWSQGERDSNVTINTGASRQMSIGQYYASNLIRFALNWRADITGFTNAKFVWSRIHTLLIASYFTKYIADQQVLAKASITKSDWVNTDDIAFVTGDIHYTGDGQITLAGRAFTAFQAL